MEKIEIDKSALLQAYNEGTAPVKYVLKKLHGEKVFETNDYSKIKSFEDACKVLKITPAKVFAKTDSKDEIAYKKLKVIVKVLNGGWTPDWKNDDEAKWYPWWNMQNGFSLNDVYVSVANTFVGSRLCYKSREIAEYACKQFIGLYKDYIA